MKIKWLPILLLILACQSKGYADWEGEYLEASYVDESYLGDACCEPTPPTCTSKIDVGPAYVHIDMLESGHTRRKLDLYAGRVDATFLIWKGLCIKPSAMFAGGEATLNTGSLGLGFCYPVTPKISITPSFGVTGTYFKAGTSFPQFGLYHLHEKFKSWGGYICLEGSWTFYPKWRLCGTFTYVWSKVKTTVKPLFSSNDHSKGPSYALQLERDINANWSCSIAGAYNISLSKEKHGLRGAGAKIGVAYWY